MIESYQDYGEAHSHIGVYNFEQNRRIYVRRDSRLIQLPGRTPTLPPNPEP